LLPGCRVLIYTALTDSRSAIEALAAGADGFALKTDGVEELLSAIRTVTQGQRYLSPAVELALRGEGAPVQGMQLSVLSAREREIFDLVITGYSNQKLAAELFISVKTVETHRGSINKKLAVHSTGQLVRFAALNGLLPFNASTQWPQGANTHQLR
jgi:two-component system response regulator NreC